MNPLCPYDGKLLVTKFRTMTDKAIKRQYGFKVWECQKCKRRWKKGSGVILKGTEINMEMFK
jgi:ribosomal protein L37AE/L43A